MRINTFHHVETDNCDFCDRRALWTYLCTPFRVPIELKDGPAVVEYGERWHACLRCAGLIDTHCRAELIEAAYAAVRRATGTLHDKTAKHLLEAYCAFWALRLDVERVPYHPSAGVQRRRRS